MFQPDELKTRDLSSHQRLVNDVIAAYTTGDPDSLQRITDYYQPSRKPSLDQFRAAVRERLNIVDAEAPLTLADAQLFVARGEGFESWAELEEHADE